MIRQPPLDHTLFEQDRCRMLGAVHGMPEHFGLGAAASLGTHLAGTVDRVVLCGMGGSAFPADVIAAHAQSIGAPLSIEVSRDYVVRARLDARTLVVASSYSGNTEETLAAFEDAGARGAQRLAIGAGGQLEELARAAQAPFIRLPRPSADFQPRAATALFVGALGQVLSNAALLPDMGDVLKASAAHLAAVFDGLPARALPLVSALRDRIPIVVAPAQSAVHLARVIKIKFNENAKVPAFWNSIPEMNHNEMVGFTRSLAPFALVMLVPAHGLSTAMVRRFQATRSTLADYGVPSVEIKLPALPALLQAFEIFTLFDFVTCGLARLAGLDPNPVELLETFKVQLRT